MCAEAEKFTPYYTQGYWNYGDYDVTNTRYMICWGVDPLFSNRQVYHYLNAFGGMLKNGVRIATVDPKYSNTAAKSLAWLPVKSGEDGALATAMAYFISFRIVFLVACNQVGIPIGSDLTENVMVRILKPPGFNKSRMVSTWDD